MQSNIDISSLKKRAYTSFHQDGLIDIFIGISFLLYSTVMILEKIALIAFCWVPALLIVPLKNKITVPRMGNVTFKQTRKKKRTKAMLISLVIWHVVFLLAFAKFRSYGVFVWIDEHLFILLGIMFAFIPMNAAKKTGLKRFYFYAVIICATFVLEHFYRGSAPYSFGVLGIVLALTGLIVLFTFLKKYPIPELEEEYGN